MHCDDENGDNGSGSSSSNLYGSCKPVPITVFWHIAVLGNDVWQGVMEDQYRAIINSGLTTTADHIHVHAVGRMDLLQQSPILPFPSPFILHPRNLSLDTYEFGTLSALQDYCHHHSQAWVAYVHTKGVSRPGPRQKNSQAWRHMLEHFIIHRHHSCVAVLQRGYDTCGVQFGEAAKFYGGEW